jgi:hypothetical protein
VGFGEGASFAGVSDDECLGGYLCYEDWQEGGSVVMRDGESGVEEPLTLACVTEENER